MMNERGTEGPVKCRACLQVTTLLVSHDLSEQCIPEERELTLLAVFSDVTGLQVTLEEDGLPHRLCSPCMDRARVCHLFRQQCLESHRILLARKDQTHDNTNASMAIAGKECKVTRKQSNSSSNEKTKRKRTNKRVPKRTNKACEQLYGDALWSPVACSECPVSVDNVPLLIAHRVAHHTARFQCLQCGGALTTSRGLRLHQRRHAGVRLEVCSSCGATFSDPRTRIIHEKRHAGTLRHVCGSCGRAFPARRPLERHRAAQHAHTLRSRT